MTLNEWQSANVQAAVLADGRGGFRVYGELNPVSAWDLFHLADYVVDAVLGGPHWHLCPR